MPVTIIYMGRRAEHDMNGSIIIVMILDRRLSMVRVAITAGTLQPKPMMSGMNDLPRHVARVLHQRDEEVEYQNLRQEHNHRPHTANDAVDQHRAQRSLSHRRTYPVAQPPHACIYPVHRILTKGKRGLEHHKQYQEENGKTDVFVRQHIVYHVRIAVDVLFRTRPVAGLGQRTVDKAILGIHDGRLRVATGFFQHTVGGVIAHSQQLFAILRTVLISKMLTHVLRDIGVILQQLDSQIARRITLAYMLVSLQELLYVADAVLYLMTVVDVDVT